MEKYHTFNVDLMKIDKLSKIFHPFFLLDFSVAEMPKEKTAWSPKKKNSGSNMHHTVQFLNARHMQHSSFASVNIANDLVAMYKGH